MDAPEKFSVTRSAANKLVGFAEDIYADLQFRSRKLNAVKIRASEVHLKTGHQVKAGLDVKLGSALSSILCGSKLGGSRSQREPTHAGRTRHGNVAGASDHHAIFKLPGYILEMKQELVEDEIDVSEVERVATPVADAIDIGDVAPGLGAATPTLLAKEDGVASEAVGTVRVTAPPRTRAEHRVLPPLPKSIAPRVVELEVPRMPTVEKMPQHLASDIYRVHRPVYISSSQVRWETRDGVEVLIPMRTEIMRKVDSEGKSRMLAGACSPKHVKGNMLAKIWPAEAKIRAGMGIDK